MVLGLSQGTLCSQNPFFHACVTLKMVGYMTACWSLAEVLRPLELTRDRTVSNSSDVPINIQLDVDAYQVASRHGILARPAFACHNICLTTEACTDGLPKTIYTVQDILKVHVATSYIRDIARKPRVTP